MRSWIKCGQLNWVDGGLKQVATYLCKMETRVHTGIGIVLALIFGAFAAVQYNDPDPLTWIAIYGCLVVMHVWSIFKPIPLFICLFPMIAAIVGAVLLWPEEFQGLTGKMDSRPGVELARESLGLIICALGCMYLTIRSVVRVKRSRKLV